MISLEITWQCLSPFGFIHLIMDVSEFIHDSGFRQLLSSEFTSEDQKLFVQSFTTYLQYGNDDTKFVINFDDVWKWVGYTRKDNAKAILQKYFKEDVDYTSENVFLDSQENPLGGRPKQNIFLNVATFKEIKNQSALALPTYNRCVLNLLSFYFVVQTKMKTI